MPLGASGRSVRRAGILLARLYQVSGALYGPIALHAGWIFCMKLHAGLTVEKDGGFVRIWGSGRLIDGWAAFAVMVLCAMLVFRRKSRP